MTTARSTATRGPATPALVMIVRHAEKPTADGRLGGVTADGRADPHSLSVRGWQRAGALVPFFTATAPSRRSGIDVPAVLCAPRPTDAAPSRRAGQTLEPLADALGLSIDLRFAKGDEAELAHALRGAQGPVLIAWEHRRIPALVDGLCDAALQRPSTWPDDRFDLVWCLRRGPGAAPFALSQVPQLLLHGDSARPIE